MPSLTAYSAADGTPLVGLSPSWFGYVNALTGADKTPQPSFTGLGDGEYRIDAADALGVGVIDWGVTAMPRYELFNGSTQSVFLAYDSEGVPLTGLGPTWLSYKVEATGANDTQPTITPLGYGLYLIESPSPLNVGMIDLGALALSRYQRYGIAQARDVTPPAISDVSPVVGSVVGRYEALQFKVTDAVALRLCMIVARFSARQLVEVVHDGTVFSPLYVQGSTRTAVTGGYAFSILRAGGWPEGPTIEPFAIDTSGNENT